MCDQNRLKTHCPKGHEYTPENTYTYPGTKSGRICKTCTCERTKQRRAAGLENQEKRRAGNKRHYWRNPEKRRAASLRWYERNRDKLKARFREYLKQHRERRLVEMREWVKANPEKRRANTQRRRARQLEAPGSCTGTQWEARLAYFGNRCRYCGTDKKLGMDHMIPLSRGGSAWASNLVPCCNRCNRSKGSKTFLEFISQCQ